MDPPISLAPGRRTPVEPKIIHHPIAAHRIDPDAAKVVRRLGRHGHMAYLVGGCVRDLLLDRHPKDFDIATSARPNEVKALFRNCRVIGRRFRLAHVLFAGGKIIEVATFRRDPGAGIDASNGWDSPGAHEPFGDDADRTSNRRRANDADDLLIRHDNVFGTPHEDALRRDFTINALFYDIERQEIVDYVSGLRDVERRVVRTIGEPDIRFREDPVRILRAIKFVSRLDLGMDPDIYDAIVMHREDLLRSARPRLLEEMLRLLRSGASRRAFWLAWETGVLAVLSPELNALLDDDPTYASLLWRRLAAIDDSVATGDLPSDCVLLATLMLEPVEEAIEGARDVLGAIGDSLADFHTRLSTPRRMVDRLKQIVSVQRRLRQGRVGSLARRDFYAEAAALFAIDAAARGTPTDVVDAILAGRDVQRVARTGPKAQSRLPGTTKETALGRGPASSVPSGRRAGGTG